MYCTTNLATKKPKQLRHLDSITRYSTHTNAKNDHFFTKILNVGFVYFLFNLYPK